MRERRAAAPDGQGVARGWEALPGSAAVRGRRGAWGGPGGAAEGSGLSPGPEQERGCAGGWARARALAGSVVGPHGVGWAPLGQPLGPQGKRREREGEGCGEGG